jgi:ABC-type molybdate transport system substrate-binding protein
LPTIYSVAMVSAAGGSDAARAFVRVLSGAEGRAAIERAGLEPLNTGC